MTPETEKLVLKALVCLGRVPWDVAGNHELADQIQKKLDELEPPTVESVYGKPLVELKPPEGYRFTGEFRVRKEYELFLTKDGQRAEYHGYLGAVFDGAAAREPRLILVPSNPHPVFVMIGGAPIRDTDGKFVLERAVRSVYGKPLEQPKGYRFTGEFRVSPYGEWHLDADTGLANTLLPHSAGPRLILKPAKRLVFDVIDESRPPKKGEYWATEQGWYGYSDWDHAHIDNCRYILSEPRVEE